MFNLSFHFTKGGFVWKQRVKLSQADETGKTGKAEKTNESGKADKASMAKRTDRPERPLPTLSGFVHAAAEGVSLSTQENYRTAVRSFIRFSGGTDVPVSALD
ncbi:hypothetical protein, partial [Bacteroides zoogleoformans]|uniref:hypothetical protein n=1 Tax=Bacteroides zoogleoformans TaxID=28119 RepID=UPI00248EE205